MRTCPDCGVEPGLTHLGGCDVARCKVCGSQAMGCDEHAGAPATLWTGRWPGEVECEELGLWGFYMPPRRRSSSLVWVPCSAPDHPRGANHDLNRLFMMGVRGEIVWSPDQERFVIPTKET